MNLTRAEQLIALKALNTLLYIMDNQDRPRHPEYVQAKALQVKIMNELLKD